MPSRVCIYCGSDLLPDPRFPHWAHCPTCNPAWFNSAVHVYKSAAAQDYAAGAVADKRGTPTRNGKRA